jgi:hypothetical protein
VVRIYCRVTGVILLALGVLGLLNWGVPGSLSLNDMGEVLLHFVAGLIACVVGFGPMGKGAGKLYAGVFGLIFVLLAILGLIQPSGVPTMHLDLADNMLHMGLGIWGLLVGFAEPEPYNPPAQVGQAGA